MYYKLKSHMHTIGHGVRGSVYSIEIRLHKYKFKNIWMWRECICEWNSTFCPNTRFLYLRNMERFTILRECICVVVVKADLDLSNLNILAMIIKWWQIILLKIWRASFIISTTTTIHVWKKCRIFESHSRQNVAFGGKSLQFGGEIYNLMYIFVSYRNIWKIHIMYTHFDPILGKFCIW